MKKTVVYISEKKSLSRCRKQIAQFWKTRNTTQEPASQRNSQVHESVHAFSHGYVPVWQSIEWGEFLIRTNFAQDVIFFGIEKDEQLLAYAVAEIRSIGLWQRAAFVIGWPNGNDPDAIDLLVQTISQTVSESTALFVQIEPVHDLSSAQFDQIPVMRPWQFRYLLEPVTRMIDLRQSEEEILAGMKQKGRYNIKIAEKGGCVVKKAEPTSQNVGKFMMLLSETLARDGFSGNTESYYRDLLESRKHPSEGLYFSYCNDQLVAAAILIIEGNTAVYYYGASTSDSELRKYMPAYLIQWRMMQAAKSAGCETYDFLGIAPEGEPNHHLAGVTDFKSKFWGIVVTFPKKRQLVLRPLLTFVFRAFRRLRKLI